MTGSSLKRHDLADRAARMAGAALYRPSSHRRRLRYLSVHEPPLKPGTLAAACAQRYLLDSATPEPTLAARDIDLDHALEPGEYVPELEAALSKMDYLPAGILNTEALLLWALIRRARPRAYLESGTGRGYSAALAAQALQANGDGAPLCTFGIDEPGIVETARDTLDGYADCTFVEGPSDSALPAMTRQVESPVGVFIDGPKGSSPAFVRLLEQLFDTAEPIFVAVHDCEAHLPRGFDPAGKWPRGRINPTRAQLDHFYVEAGLERRFALVYMDTQWCLRYERLNESIYRQDPTLAPFLFKKSRQVSHSPVIGVLLERGFLAQLHSDPGKRSLAPAPRG